MPVRSIIDIDVNDQAFQRFNKLFQQYQVALKSTPLDWRKMAEAQQQGVKGFRDLVLQQASSIGKQKLLNEATQAANRLLRSNADVWRDINRSTGEAVGKVAAITTSLLKWTALTSVFSGLLGAGGLFGIERLAEGVASGRRSSLGTGISYGQQAAFGLNFGRLVDPGSFLGAVNEAQHDVTKRSALYGAGLREGDINNQDSAAVGSQLLTQLKKIVDGTPEAQLAQVLQARGLNQFLSLQDAQRLRNTSPAELAQLQAGFRTDQNTLGLSPDNAKVWQDFSNQMERAGSTIENTFVKGLQPLIPSLNDLSVGVTKAVAAFLHSPKLGEWIDDLAVGLEKGAKYLGSQEFQDKVVAFVDGLGTIADYVVKVAGWVGTASPGSTTRAFAGSGSGGAHDAGAAILPSVAGNNPGNLRPPGSSTGFQKFATPEDGYRAMARQLALYQNRDHLETIAQIVNKWAPPSENDTASYIGDVVKRTGYGSQSRIDLSNPDNMAKLVAAMAHHENSKNNISPDAVKITIYGAPGGNAITTAHQTTTPGGG